MNFTDKVKQALNFNKQEAAMPDEKPDEPATDEVKSSKFKNTVFLINTLPTRFYVTMGISKSDQASPEDTLVFQLSIDKARVEKEADGEEVHELDPKNDMVFKSNYPKIQLLVLDEEDLIFDAQYANNEDGDILIATLVKKAEVNRSTAN